MEGLPILSQVFFRETFVWLLFNSFKAAPFWVPIALGWIFWKIWVPYRRTQFLEKQEYVLLEIKIPKDVSKSPLAMEIVLEALHQTVGESTMYDRYILGKVRADFSLELISIEGNIHFLIRMRKSFKRFFETQVYAQYPSAEVYEVPDYVHAVPFAEKGSDWNIWGAEFTLSKPDPYPIKTYVDYGLDKDQFEEKKIDPITSMLEFLGSLGKGEQVWFQILVRSNKGKKDMTSPWKRDWHDESKELIDEIIEKAKDRSGLSSIEEENKDFRSAILTEGERNLIKAIDRNTSKHGFDCGMRGIYLAQKDHYDPSNIPGLFGVIKQYSSEELNGFKPIRYTDVDYPWQKYVDIGPRPISLKGLRVSHMKWTLFDSYRRRGWFFPPYERKPFVLNTEELATIFHFPGQVSETATLGRIESQKAESPPNLPK